MTIITTKKLGESMGSDNITLSDPIAFSVGVTGFEPATSSRDSRVFVRSRWLPFMAVDKEV